MKITETETRTIKITELKNLDPVTVMIQDYEPGKGRITIECYGESWTAYWGAMSGKSVTEFFQIASVEYLIEKLAPSVSEYIPDPDDGVLVNGEEPEYEKNIKWEYIGRIVSAVQECFHQLEKKEQKCTQQ